MGAGAQADVTPLQPAGTGAKAGGAGAWTGAAVKTGGVGFLNVVVCEAAGACGRTAERGVTGASDEAGAMGAVGARGSAGARGVSEVRDADDETDTDGFT